MRALRAFFQAYTGPLHTRINDIRFRQQKYNMQAPYIICPLPITNFVNSCANQPGIGLKECPKRAHSPFMGAFHSAPFSLLSRLDYCPHSPPRHRLLPLPIPNFVNSHANWLGMGLKECPKRAHSPFPSAIHLLHSRCNVD